MIAKSKDRTRRWRERGIRGQRIVNGIRLDKAEVEKLVDRNYLAEGMKGSAPLLTEAVEAFLSDKLTE
jgi:hypothetical protein